MTKPRPEEVTRIYQALMETLEEYVDGASAGEIISAAFTLTVLLMEGALRGGADMEAFRDPLARLYGALPPLKKEQIS